MSDETTSSSESATTEKPKRNPMERLLVWGLIGVMVLFVCTEGIAKFGYSITLPRLQERLREDDSDEPNPLTVEEAETLIFGFPSKTVEDQKVVYRWKGLLKDFGAIHLPYDDDNIVLSLVTDAPPEIEEPTPVVATGDEEPGPNDPSMIGGGGAPPAGEGAGAPEGEGGGGRNFDPMQFDKDEDGKISKEEAPERMQQFFDRIDSNGDGFADAEEFKAMREARRNQEGQRPESEEEAPEKAVEEKPEAKEEAPPAEEDSKEE